MIEAKDTGEVAQVVTSPEAAPPAEATEPTPTSDEIAVKELLGSPEFKNFLAEAKSLTSKATNLIEEAQAGYLDRIDRLPQMIAEHGSKIPEVVNSLTILVKQLAPNSSSYPKQITDDMFTGVTYDSLKANASDKNGWLPLAHHIITVTFNAALMAKLDG